jgi:glycosyltransferase involved in cell wall biosynthesis
MAKVSVIIPNYNSERFLRDTIEHVLRQTFADWELLVVDDNSTDNSRESVRDYIRRYPDRGISLVQNEAGPSSTATLLNLGIRHMHGEFVAWLNSGDLCEPEKLEEQVRAFERQPNLALVHTAFQTIDTDGRVTGSFFPPNQFESDALTALLDGNFINSGTVLVRKAAMEEAGTLIETDAETPELWRAAGYYQWLKIAAKYPIHCLERTLHRSRARNADGEDPGAMEMALERILIRRFLKEQSPQPTAAIVLALAGRGLWREAFVAADKLTPDSREQALSLIEALERDQERWDLEDYGNVRRVDNARIRAAFRSRNANESRALLEAVTRLESPETQPYRAAAARKLVFLA